MQVGKVACQRETGISSAPHLTEQTHNSNIFSRNQLLMQWVYQNNGPGHVICQQRSANEKRGRLEKAFGMEEYPPHPTTANKHHHQRLTGVIWVLEQRFGRPESKTKAVSEKINILTLDTREQAGSELEHTFSKPVRKGGTAQNCNREIR